MGRHNKRSRRYLRRLLSSSSSSSEYDSESSESRSPSRSPEASAPETPAPEPAQAQEDAPAKMLFCSIQEENLQPTTCNACYRSSQWLKPTHAKSLLARAKPKAQGDIPSKGERLQRSDEVTPTLVLSENAMVLGEKVFSMGRFKIPRHFEELTKEYLSTPKGQHELLMANLTQEQLLTIIEQSGDSKPVFTYKNQVVKVVRDLCVATVNSETVNSFIMLLCFV